ncbi:MAG: glycosyltransferase family 2 protein [Bacteroidales bacterium]|nr:glycosyltransferase family 2 protein [Bacteroidales bacterium]
MTTAVVILNWNGRKMLERFLPSVTLHSTGDTEVIIADNGSTDDSLAFVREHYPSLRIIELDKNYGFAGGYNRALEQVEADYYVLLNDDVEVTPNWIEPVIAQMEQHPGTAICQPKLLMYDQRDTFEYAGGAGGFIDNYGYPFCRGRMFTTLEQDHGQYDDPCPIFWATGAAMFVRSSVWKELGGLDDDFFAHMEEIDFCWRAKNAGYEVEYCPQSVVYHVGGGTLPKSNPHKTYLNFRNNMALLYKNLPQNRLAWVMVCRVVLDYVAAFKFLMERKPKEFSAVVKAHRAFYKWMPRLKMKRQRRGQQHPVSCIYPRLILVDYYLLGHHLFSQLQSKQK